MLSGPTSICTSDDGSRSSLSSRAHGPAVKPHVKPDGISSMLKTSMEIGDVGPFATPTNVGFKNRPSHVPKHSRSALLDSTTSAIRPSRVHHYSDADLYGRSRAPFSSQPLQQRSTRSSCSVYRRTHQFRGCPTARGLADRVCESSLRREPVAVTNGAAMISGNWPTSSELTCMRSSSSACQERLALRRSRSVLTSPSHGSLKSVSTAAIVPRGRKLAVLPNKQPPNVIPRPYASAAFLPTPTQWAASPTESSHLPFHSTSNVISLHSLRSASSPVPAPYYYDYSENFAEEPDHFPVEPEVENNIYSENNPYRCYRSSSAREGLLRELPNTTTERVEYNDVSASVCENSFFPSSPSNIPASQLGAPTGTRNLTHLDGEPIAEGAPCCSEGAEQLVNAIQPTPCEAGQMFEEEVGGSVLQSTPRSTSNHSSECGPGEEASRERENLGTPKFSSESAIHTPSGKAAEPQTQQATLPITTSTNGKSPQADHTFQHPDPAVVEAALASSESQASSRGSTNNGESVLGAKLTKLMGDGEARKDSFSSAALREPEPEHEPRQKTISRKLKHWWHKTWSWKKCK